MKLKLEKQKKTQKDCFGNKKVLAKKKMEQVQAQIDKLNELNEKYDDLNHPEKLEIFKSVRSYYLNEIKFDDIENKTLFVLFPSSQMYLKNTKK